MSLISMKFLIFVLVCVLGYYIIPKKFQWMWLLVFSYIYYASSRIKITVFLLFSTLSTYLIALFIERIPKTEKTKRKIALITGLILNFGMLGALKYTNFLIDNINNLISVNIQPISLLLPLGISFYSFKMIAYLVDIYQKKISEVRILDFAIYISFFPTFTAGPINKIDSFIKQLNTKYVFDYHNSKNGTVLCAFGMFEKIVFADYLKNIIDTILMNNKADGIYTIVAVILYSFYIYLDFDGYSNVAIGVSRILGFNIDRNFKTPYLASSIMEFWDRWHISLSNWLKEYIYIPLGGSRKGDIRKYLNILIVFIISGIWHGSTINFVIWGLGHGILNIIENIIKKVTKDLNFPVIVKWLGKLVGIVINFTLVTFLWIFFSSGSFENAFNIIFKCLLYESIDFNPNVIHVTVRESYWILVIVSVTIITDILRNKMDMIEWLARRNFVIRWTVYALLILIVIIFGVYGPGYNASDFIYNAF